MRVSFKSTLHFSLLGAALGLVACSSGGDGGGGGFIPPNISTQPVAITSDNEGEVAQAGFDGAQGGMGLASATDLVPIAAATAGSNTTSSNINLYRTVRKFVDAAIDKQIDQTSTLSVTGVEFSDSASCAYQDPVTNQTIGSGSESFRASIADFNQQTGEPNSFSNGDYISVTFNNCDYGDGVVQNGSMTMTFNSNVSLMDVNAEVFSMNVTASFNNLSMTSITTGVETLHGTINLAFDVNGTSVSFNMSGSSFYAVSSAESVHLTNFSFSASTDGINSSVQATFTIASTMLDGQITVESQFSSNGAGYPTSGSMTITGDNSQLVVSVNGDGTTATATVNVTLTINGMVQAGYPKDVTWSELGVEVNNAF